MRNWYNVWNNHTSGQMIVSGCGVGFVSSVCCFSKGERYWRNWDMVWMEWSKKSWCNGWMIDDMYGIWIWWSNKSTWDTSFRTKLYGKMMSVCRLGQVACCWHFTTGAAGYAVVLNGRWVVMFWVLCEVCGVVRGQLVVTGQIQIGVWCGIWVRIALVIFVSCIHVVEVP